MANQNTILYQKIPAAMQGRVFAVRNAIQYSTIPAGIILALYLSYIFVFIMGHTYHKKYHKERDNPPLMYYPISLIS